MKRAVACTEGPWWSMQGDAQSWVSSGFLAVDFRYHPTEAAIAITPERTAQFLYLSVEVPEDEEAEGLLDLASVAVVLTAVGCSSGLYP